MKARILIADDHAMLRECLRSLISAQPELEVVAEAGEQREVLWKVQEQRPDIVLLDLSMPGGSGIETLTRTLPYAGANPDYHAFLAGALQRQQRHREAAAEYLAALRSAPANGVWWMGMGISLQAEKRNSEALEAFQKAQASGVLSAELQAFVERQIRQLGR